MKLITLDEVYELFKARQKLTKTMTGEKSRMKFCAFCAMIEEGGYRII